jgi:hypothetical protein
MAVLAALAAAVLPQSVSAGGFGDSNNNPSPVPTSTGSASVVLNTLQAGAGGTYAPQSGNQITPGRHDPGNPIYIPPPPDPQGKVCPPTTIFHTRAPGSVIGPGIPAGNIIAVLTIYPTFTKNAQGGYDGSDPQFGYAVANAIPSGGDPAAASIGSPATAATAAGHIVAVDAWLRQFGTWQDATPGVPPYGGSCQGAGFAFTAPFLAGYSPPPIPPASVLNTPPFALGNALMAEVTGTWRIGHVATMPGPDPTARTYVHIPTCAWLDSGVPTGPVQMHAIKATTEAGVTLFLVYNLTVTPGPVTWDWGDGTQVQTGGAVESPPPTTPSYDPTSQTWTDPCTVSHPYGTVADGRTITATETFAVLITVSWDDGVTVHTAPVPCDPATSGPCQLSIGAANGWTSGPHPVDQIEPVPYVQPSPSTH